MDYGSGCFAFYRSLFVIARGVEVKDRKLTDNQANGKINRTLLQRP